MLDMRYETTRLNTQISILKSVKTLWWYCRACSPLPIPNREVKPPMADGTAQQCGRVGSCHIHFKSPDLNRSGLFAFIQYRRIAAFILNLTISMQLPNPVSLQFLQASQTLP